MPENYLRPLERIGALSLESPRIFKVMRNCPLFTSLISKCTIEDGKHSLLGLGKPRQSRI